MEWLNSRTFIFLDHKGHLACDPKHEREVKSFLKTSLRRPDADLQSPEIHADTGAQEIIF